MKFLNAIVSIVNVEEIHFSGAQSMFFLYNRLACWKGALLAQCCPLLLWGELFCGLR